MHPLQHRVQVKANTSFNITPCNAATFCGHSTPTGSDAGYACQSIALPADAPAGTLAEAQQALLSMYPPSVDVLLQVGGSCVSFAVCLQPFVVAESSHSPA